MSTQFLELAKGRLAYEKWGNGPDLLIAIHGFGDSALLFNSLSGHLGKAYTCYALTLPYHGPTQWHSRTFTPGDLHGCIAQVLQLENRQQFTLMGYSMGGKISLKLFPHFAAQIKKLILLAPDGIATHKYYDISRLPKWFVKLFKLLLRWPKLFFRLVKLVHAKGILSKFLFDFTNNHFGTPAQRRRFFSVSESILAFQPQVAAVKEMLNKHDTPVEVYLGIRDEVIPPKVGAVLKEGLDDCQVYFLDKGHLLVDEDLGKMIMGELQPLPKPILNTREQNTASASNRQPISPKS